MALFLFIVFIVSLAGVLSLITHRKIDLTIALSISCIIITLYIFGLFNVLVYGVYFIILVSFICLVICILYFFKDKDFKNRILTPGLLAFIIAVLYFYHISKGCALTEWDNFSHWALVVKQMFLRDKISIFFGTEIRFPEYPPATALFQYLLEKISLILGGDFSEPNLLRAMGIQAFACMLPVFGRLDWKFFSDKNIVIAIIRMGLILFVPLLCITLIPMYFNTLIYYSLYVDGILGIYFAYILYQYFCDRELTAFTFLSLAATCFVITIIKSAGIAVSSIAVAIIAFDLLLFRKNELKQFISAGKQRKKIVYGLAIIFSVPIMLVLSNLSWSAACSAANITEHYSASGITAAKVIELIKGNGQEYQYTAMKNFIARYKSTVKLVIAQLILASGFVLCYLKTNRSKARWAVFISLLFVFNILYAFVQLLLYLYVFASVEAVNLASYDRYMSIILIGMTLILVYLLFDRLIFTMNTKEERKLQCISLTAIFCFMSYYMPSGSFRDSIIAADTYAAQTVSIRQGFNYENKISSLLDKDEDRIFYISQHSSGYDYWVACYNLLPIRCSPAFSWSIGSFSGSDSTYNNDMYMRKLSVKEWENEIISGGYTYVLLHSIDDEFIALYASLFESAEAISSTTLYRVEKDDNKIRLVNVEIN